MDCHNEAHDHDHSHGGGDHAGHSHEVPLSAGPNDSLYQFIDLPNVVALNAEGGGQAGQSVIKPWDRKEDETVWCESDTDETMMIKIPFTASLSLRSITIKAGPSGKTPSAVHLYKDGVGMDFSDTDREATQVIDLVEKQEAVEYQVKAAKFASLSSLAIYIPGNSSDGDEDTSRVYYVGLRGSHKPLPGRPGVIIYESAARPTDHVVKGAAEGAAFRPAY